MWERVRGIGAKGKRGTVKGKRGTGEKGKG
jgi:hypothetical protein